MNTWRKKPVTLIVADAGPLISLACADELGLLQSFGQPVVVADVVRMECTKKIDAPGQSRLIHWFETGGGNQFRNCAPPSSGTSRRPWRKWSLAKIPTPRWASAMLRSRGY